MDLIERLRALARHEHSDVSIAEEAAAALEAAREDAERLDHFAWTGGQLVCRDSGYAFVDSHDGRTEYFPTYREAIDQARGKEVPDA